MTMMSDDDDDDDDDGGDDDDDDVKILIWSLVASMLQLLGYNFNLLQIIGLTSLLTVAWPSKSSSKVCSPFFNGTYLLCMQFFMGFGGKVIIKFKGKKHFYRLPLHDLSGLQMVTIGDQMKEYQRHDAFASGH